MLGIKDIVKDPIRVEKELQKKDKDVRIGPVVSAYEEMCRVKTNLEDLRAKLNHHSKEIGEYKRAGKDPSALMHGLTEIKEASQKAAVECSELEAKFESLIAGLPNLPDSDIKVSEDPADNVCVKTSGKKREFGFTPKNHLELSDIHNLFDFKRGAKLSGTGWPVYTGVGAQLEWALLNLMIETHNENGFTFHLLPHLVRPDVMYGSGQLPKFEHQLFKVKDEDYELYLIPTAEVALNGLHYDEILKEDELPKRYSAYTPCFRREAGAAGSQERGLIRVHQFNKVEMFAFCTPEESNQIFDQMVASAELILEKLELHYRSMLLVTGDMSYGAARTLDIEVWLPGQNRYYEVSSVSNCRDFQARRSKIRYKTKDGQTQFVHTLNGSGLATSRLMVALLENNQQEDGSIILPKALQKTLGVEILQANSMV